MNNSLCAKKWNYISSVSPKIDNCELFVVVVVICESRYISLENVFIRCLLDYIFYIGYT